MLRLRMIAHAAVLCWVGLCTRTSARPHTMDVVSKARALMYRLSD